MPSKPKRLQDFASDLETAVNAVLPSPENKYKKVSVFAFHWENDTMGVETLEMELLEVFKSVYNYSTDRFVIPTKSPRFSLASEINSWSGQHAGKDTVRIYIYSGHAGPSGSSSSAWHLAGESSSWGQLVGPTVDWRVVRVPVEDLEGDICYIFDYCSAGSVAMHDGPETIAAIGWEEAAGARFETSFTRALVNTLRELNGRHETLAAIYARLFRDAFKSQVAAVPVHVPKRGAPSITFAPCSDISRPVTRRMATGLHHSTDYRVLLSVHIRGHINEADLEHNNLPSGVKIESVFRGFGIILFTVPVEMWTMLSAEDSSFRFLAHVT
ncbi:hypothetical protein ASPZODRAFT_61988 [Penicilliopsis zonata CBS 506.65]|uniref:Uncharacterized protein n=1 Tax=Penicilliopsis zonata CBS 506.65 TaxID=1073090 RepID=A0A1L9SN04_9EURO|nr:hypothetical protein ASPZODRAFT_61988 [Penicilliopsis zonata CBS 506.65]OJJ48417.1 hypothetical protein ASPZODRAFT_61988 [Penicilliopsis zonata CBS 506.65]